MIITLSVATDSPIQVAIKALFRLLNRSHSIEEATFSNFGNKQHFVIHISSPDPCQYTPIVFIVMRFVLFFWVIEKSYCESPSETYN